MKDSKHFWNKQAKNFKSNDNKELDQLIFISKKYFNDNDIVLDFACGTGDSTLAIANTVKEIYGVDYSDEMIKFASLKEKHQTNIHFVATTIEDKIFATEFFDVIIAFNILHLLDEFDDVMTRMYHLLKPGGLLISNTACMGEKKNITTFMINAMSKFGMFPSVKSYKCYELEGKICSIGFTSIESVISSDAIPNMYLVSKKC